MSNNDFVNEIPLDGVVSLDGPQPYSPAARSRKPFLGLARKMFKNRDSVASQQLHVSKRRITTKKKKKRGKKKIILLHRMAPLLRWSVTRKAESI